MIQKFSIRVFMRCFTLGWVALFVALLLPFGSCCTSIFRFRVFVIGIGRVVVVVVARRHRVPLGPLLLFSFSFFLPASFACFRRRRLFYFPPAWVEQGGDRGVRLRVAAFHRWRGEVGQHHS